MSRGRQRNPTFVHINLRVSQEVYDFFVNKGNLSGAIREVLDAYVEEHRSEMPPATKDDRQLDLPVE